MSLSREQITEIVKAVTDGTLAIEQAERAIYIGSYPGDLPKPSTMTVVAYIAVNEEGNVEASDQRGDALERLAENHGGAEAQVIKVTLTLPAPRTFETAITIEAGQVETVKIEA